MPASHFKVIGFLPILISVQSSVTLLLRYFHQNKCRGTTDHHTTEKGNIIKPFAIIENVV